jgi:hypothetical protein
MAKKANKTKSKRRSTPKFKAKRSGSKPLMAKAASVRTAKSTISMRRGSNGKPPTSALNPALSGSRPLMAEAASVRTAKPSTSMSNASNGKPTTSPLNPALSESKPLMAEAYSPSTSTSMGRGSNGQPPATPLNPALTVIAMMGRVMGAYAEFPARLAQCRSPMDIWTEQARLVQRFFNTSPVSVDRPLSGRFQ